MAHTVMQLAGFIRMFFAFKMSSSLTVRVKMEFKLCHKKSVAFLAQIFMKFAHYRQHYVRVSCTEYRADATKNVESSGSISFTPLVKV
jgi:hypothetical protein